MEMQRTEKVRISPNGVRVHNSNPNNDVKADKDIIYIVARRNSLLGKSLLQIQNGKSVGWFYDEDLEYLK